MKSSNTVEYTGCVTDLSSHCQETKHRKIYNAIPFTPVRKIYKSCCHICQKLGEVYSCCPFYKPSHQFCLDHFRQYIPQNKSNKCPSCLYVCSCSYCSLNPNDPRLLSSITTPMSDSEETAITREYPKVEERAHYRISKSQPKRLSVRKLSEDTMIEESSDNNNSDDDDDNDIIEMKKYNNKNSFKKRRKNENENEKMEIENTLSSSSEEEEDEKEKEEDFNRNNFNNNNNNNNNNNEISNNDEVYYKIKSKHYKFKRMKISKSALIHGYGITISEYDALKTDEHISKCVICTDGGELILCDTCPLSYHKNCVKLDDDDDLDKKWVCPNCVKMFSNPPFMLRNLQNHYSLPLFEACKDIIYLLFTLCDFQILHGESPDNDLYLQLTNEPISYEDVICKFSKQIYTSIGDIYADLQTIWDNCITYFTTIKSQKNLAKSKCLAHFTKILWFSTLYKINDK